MIACVCAPLCAQTSLLWFYGVSVCVSLQSHLPPAFSSERCQVSAKSCPVFCSYLFMRGIRRGNGAGRLCLQGLMAVTRQDGLSFLEDLVILVGNNLSFFFLSRRCVGCSGSGSGRRRAHSDVNHASNPSPASNRGPSNHGPPNRGPPNRGPPNHGPSDPGPGAVNTPRADFEDPLPTGTYVCMG